MMIIRKAELSDIKELTRLMMELRTFYQQESKPEELQTFIKSRINNRDSVIFVAEENNKLVGYVQLFPSFSTIKLSEIWVLNDLFVLKSFRGKGVASQLVDTVLKFSEKGQRKQVWLLTGNDNKKAQRLYKRKGFINTKFKHYVFNIKTSTTN
ncbi:GNAT family N-acetyltransferase [Maribellus maritimus]|uniref:GNAT family N-acetyltransferase n=1 Tax=Maribellus maritimus TaxID=2870838 RepID=UPI001EEC3ACB|nr:GNAT family N-acetyltransferase [Maribellus maritimus]MCG6191024.1 GNAT family N-acetyltransferase [Maribellus maritimus]